MSQEYYAILLRLMQSEFDGNSFNGPNLMATLNAIPFEDLTRTDTYENYSVLAITLHVLYWKIAFAQGVGAKSTVVLPYAGQNFPECPAPLTPDAWEMILELLKQAHIEQLEAVESLDPTSMNEPMAWACTIGEALAWMATHDTYHIAQIRNMGLPLIKFD